MAILKLKPAYKDYLWGGIKLKERYNKEFEGDILAETWELSCHPDGKSIVAFGENKGKTLAEYIDLKGKEILGTNCAKSDAFPIMIKFIDAKGDLSIQVHPDDEFAKKVEGENNGKSEMWYIVECDEGSSIYYGFKKEIDEEEFRRRIKDNTLLEVLNKVPVKKGETYFIESGTIHAIGAGNVIAEIQQNSNLTYRVYDYGRKDKNGNCRELHIDKAIGATKREVPKENIAKAPYLVDCDLFKVTKLDVKDGFEILNADEKSFMSIIILDGCGKVKNDEDTVDFKKGDSIFVTANTGKCTAEGTFEALVTTI